MGGKLGYRGARRGFSPRDLLLAALAGCSGASFLAAMRDLGQALTSCQIVVSGELDPRPPQVFRKIDLLLRVAGPAHDEEAVRQASQACHGDCSIHATLSHVADITVRYELQEQP
jgi:putative redox protein